jgi:hypothetical protein
MQFDKCVLFVNLWNYDPVLPIPKNAPPNVDYIYVTDTDNNVSMAKNFGYTVYKYDIHQDLTDKFERIKIIGKFKSIPEEMIIELAKYKYIFECDANILVFDIAYTDFINNACDDYALFVTTGCYSGQQDNIYEEYKRSITVRRWSYNFKNMTDTFNTYLELFKQKNMNPLECRVVSAKYIGWNIQHKNKKLISKFVCDEYMNHLQGNIIFSVALNLFPQDIFHFRNGFSNGDLVYH